MLNEVACLNSNWLNDSIQSTTTGGTLQSSLTVTSDPGYYTPSYPWIQPISYVTHVAEARPIRLTLSEVDVLRKAAKTDEKLRTILAKFTNQIEVVVDFK